MIEINGKTDASIRKQDVRFSVEQPESERCAAVGLTISERSTKLAWHLTLDAATACKAHTLKVPVGEYELAVNAAHRRAVGRTLHVDKSAIALGVLSLTLNPVLTGTVRGSGGMPIAGAFVTDRAVLSAKTDALGRFAIEVEDKWPSWLEFSYPGAATRQVEVPKAQVSANLRDVILGKGAVLTLDIENSTSFVDVDLARERGYKNVRVLKTARTTENSQRVVFEDLDKGEYVCIIRGGGPMQRLATVVALHEGEAQTRTIRIEPLSLDIEVRRGETPVSAVVKVQSEGRRWSADLHTDSQGRIRAEAWQRGQFAFAVQLGETAPPLILLKEISGNSEASVRLDVPDRTIAGRVIDLDRKVPVPDAVVQLESVNDDGTGGTMTIKTGADGKFSVDALRDGSHKLWAEAEGYVHSGAVTVRLDAASSSAHDVLLQLSLGAERTLRVLSPDGTPVRRAAVVEMVTGTAASIYTTDDSGIVKVRTPVDASAVIFVLPAEGSFAIRRLAARRAGDDETIVVPRGGSTLEVHANDTSGRPVSHVRFLMRYDGETIPPDIADILEMRRGIAAVTGDDGVARIERLPAGYFELWPFRTAREMNDVLAAVSTDAPVQVTLKDGLNIASLTFSRKH